MAAITDLANLDIISEAWVDAVKDGLNTGVFSGTYTPTLQSMAVGTGGSANNTAYYRYVGGILVVHGIIQYGTTGVTFATTPNIFLPTGFTASPPVTPNYGTVGQASFVAGGTTTHGYMAMVSQTIVRPYCWTASGTYVGTANLAPTVPGAWAAGDYFRWHVIVPGTWA